MQAASPSWIAGLMVRWVVWLGGVTGVGRRLSFTIGPPIFITYGHDRHRGGH